MSLFISKLIRENLLFYPSRRPQSSSANAITVLRSISNIIFSIPCTNFVLLFSPFSHKILLYALYVRILQVTGIDFFPAPFEFNFSFAVKMGCSQTWCIMCKVILNYRTLHKLHLYRARKKNVCTCNMHPTITVWFKRKWQGTSCLGVRCVSKSVHEWMCNLGGDV